jgi:hypothetical protein
MAFQSDPLFADFLRRTASSASLVERAPAANFLLEERLPRSREQAFLAADRRPSPASWDVLSWWQVFGNHYSERVALPLRRSVAISTFGSENGENHLAIESHQDVVRLESIRSLYQRFPGDFDSPADLASELRNLMLSREPGHADALDSYRRSRLTLWLDELNTRRDARPAFAAPFGEVEPLLTASDWPSRLRNVLGLSHLGGSLAKPLPVVLCRYNLSRAERASRRARVGAFAAVPTILEAGGASGPGAAFFPFPRAAACINPFGFGVTVSLTADDGLDYKSELLHFRVDYSLDDFSMVGEITDEISDDALANARQRHTDLLEQELRYRSDVP